MFLRSCCLMVLVVLLFSPATVAQGAAPIAYWRLDEGTGTIAHDSSGFGNDGTIVGANWIGGRCKWALEFVGLGTDEVRDIPASFDNSITTSFSIEAWIWWYGPNPPPGLHSYIFDARAHAVNAGFIFIVTASGDIRLMTFEPSTQIHSYQSQNAVASGVWTHVAAVFDYASGTVTLYIDGLPDITHVAAAPYYDTSSTASIGNNRFFGQEATFNGIIDELRVSGGALTPQEIRDQYNNPCSQCNVRPTYINFGTLAVGDSKDTTFTITATEGDTLIGDVSESCSEFSIVSGGGPYTIAPGESLFVTVRFEPAVAGTHVCTIETGDALCGDVFCTGMTEEPLVSSIIDVGNDQGRWVRINFERSGYDIANSPFPIIQYEAFRRIDPLPSSSVVESEEKDPNFDMLYDQSVLLAGWELVETISAHGELEYNMIAPTLADSNIAQGMHWSVFFIRAATAEPLVFFDSAPDSGYSLDNLAPAAPQAFAVAYNAGSNVLTWDPSEDEDFQYFRIYRSDNPDLTIPDPPVNYSWEVVHSTIGTSWTDASDQAWRYRYQITAVDHAGNESDAASDESPTAITEPVIPEKSVLYQNAPNPFNPTTTIRYDVPAGGGRVSLRIYDVGGRLIRTLVDGNGTPGRKSATWNAKDAHGNPVSSGIYFYCLKVGGTTITKRMVYLK